MTIFAPNLSKAFTVDTPVIPRPNISTFLFSKFIFTPDFHVSLNLLHLLSIV